MATRPTIDDVPILGVLDRCLYLQATEVRLVIEGTKVMRGQISVCELMGLLALTLMTTADCTRLVVLSGQS
jgi:hypothetical protein